MTFRALKFAHALLLLSTQNAAAVPTNRTIDDQFGDSATGALPTYSPSDRWTEGTQCTTCLAQPDPELAFDHSEWMFPTIRTHL
jgi:hypothetical protein